MAKSAAIFAKTSKNFATFVHQLFVALCARRRPVKFLHRVREFCRSIAISDFRPSVGFSEYFVLSAAWLLPSFFAVIFINWFSRHHSAQYFETAISQGISPQLWNVTGAIGLLFFGLTVASLRIQAISNLFAKISSPVLRVAFEMGLLGFGLMLGKLFVAFDNSQLERWQAWFYGITLGWLFALVLAINSLLWLAARLLESKMGPAPILNKAVGWHWLLQVAVGLFFVVSPIWYFWLEK
ncbi:MAG TPA: hypothetical protein VIM41_14125 [Gammaproteobacteria bacterium]